MNRDFFGKKIFVVPHILMLKDKVSEVEYIIKQRDKYISNAKKHFYEQVYGVYIYIDIEEKKIMKVYKHIIIEYKDCKEYEIKMMIDKGSDML